MHLHSIRILILSCLCLVLSGCLSTGSLKYSQVKVLKKEGFVLTEEGWTLGLPERLLFNFDESTLKPSHIPQLNQLAKQLKKHNLDRLKIVGHSDNIGSQSYNLKLSQARAQSVANVFLEHQYRADHLKVIGRGEQQPLFANTTIENRAKNRRVAIVVAP